MTTDLREAFRRAANAVPPMGDAERAVRAGRRRRRAATVAAPLAVLAVVGGVWFVGAGSLGGGESLVVDPPPSEVTAADLAGRAFVTTEEKAFDTTVVLLFRSSELSLNEPKGTSTADYRIDDGFLTLGSEGWNPCIGLRCDSPLLSLLRRSPNIFLAGDELVLAVDDTVMRLTESDVAEADGTLTGKTWMLESYSDNDDLSVSVDVPDGVQSTLEFDDGYMGADYGCNTGGGEVTITDSSIGLDSIGTRQILCGPERMSVERAVQRVLLDDDGMLTYTIEGDTLTLTGDRGELVYQTASIESDEGDATLTGRTWVLESIRDGSTFLALPEGAESSVEFDDGAATIDHGCTTASGAVTVTDSTIEIAPVGTDDVRCGPVQTAVERFWAEKLHYVVDGNQLTLTSDGGRLIYRDADAPPER